MRRWMVLALAGLAGCATLDEPWRGASYDSLPAVRQCADMLHALDAAAVRTGTRDVEAYRIAGFPYLRVDRFGASLRHAADEGPAFNQWLSRLHTLGEEGRRVEITNLPATEIQAMETNREALLADSVRCAQLLRDQDVALGERRALIRAQAVVPDAYSTWQRVAGLYALTRIPFSSGVAQWHDEARRDFRDAAAGQPPAQPLIRYALAQSRMATRASIAAIFRRASDNPLRVPEFSEDERALLLSTFAPVFEVETGGDYDRIGRLRWGAAMAPEVDTAFPVVYQRIAFARHGDRTLTQLVYTAWFPERPADRALDLLAGKLDGVVMRVTLGPDGDPLLYDTMHPCGCYHMFFPTPRMQALPAPDGAGEWAFIPAEMPLHHAGERVAVRVATRTHYVTRVALARDDAAMQGYVLLPEGGLRSLPIAGGTRSIYGPDGLVYGTERAERLLFWPMGIASAGAMRQWGHHATAFVGRRHFDDADLIEKRFRLVAP